jgi:cyclophilin family peptidyl-prolyl cis-trans isomerase
MVLFPVLGSPAARSPLHLLTPAGAAVCSVAQDENFELAHSGPGVLSMCTHAPNANGSRFTFTLRAQPDRDGKHVAFGQARPAHRALHTNAIYPMCCCRWSY